MKNNGLFSTLFIEKIGKEIGLDDFARYRMATLVHAWKAREHGDLETLWETFMKQALSYLRFVPGVSPIPLGVYPLFEDFGYKNSIAMLCFIDPDADIDEKTIGKFWPAKLLVHLKSQKLNWGILTNGATWRLYSTKSSRPFEDFVELPLAEALESGDEREYALFERFFHKDSFVPEEEHGETEDSKKNEAAGVYKCRLDRDKEASEDTLDRYVKRPLLYQVDEVLQYLCNGFIADTPKKGEEYTEPERKEIFESAVKLLYRCLFFFYAEARRLLPSERGKAETYEMHSIRALCREARKLHWGKRKDYDGYDLWQHLKGLVNAVNDGDPEYGIMGYNGGLFDDGEEKFLGKHKLRNDFLSRALYLLAYVEPHNGNPDEEREIPYADLEVRHLGELYENILEYNVVIADAPFNRWMTKKGPILRLESDGKPSNDAHLPTKIKKGDVFFAQTALERKQTGSYYTPEPLVRFLNERAIIDPLREKFDSDYRRRFDEFLDQARSGYDASARQGATRSAVALIERFVNEELLHFKVCDPAMGSGHFLVDASNQMSGLIVELLAEIPSMDGVQANATSDPNYWRRLITRHCLYGVDLNPLAVNLARLSLWLNCFATDHRLTFIDHHLQQGNSLIGIRTLDQLREIPQRKKESKGKEKPQLRFSFDDIATSLAEAARTVKSITEIPEDDTDRQKAMYDEAFEKTQTTLAPLSDLFTAYLMDGAIGEEEYRGLFLHLAKGEHISNISNTQMLEVLSDVKGYATRHGFFHWSLAFPDVFTQDGKGGFDAIVSNPPWETWNPKAVEFFSQYYTGFSKLPNKEAKRKIMELCSDKKINEAWIEYKKYFYDAAFFFQTHPCYQHQNIQPPGNNLYKLFLERSFRCLNNEGRLSMVLPSGFYTDSATKGLRRFFLDRNAISSIYCFENRHPVIFKSVHNQFKFITLCLNRKNPKNAFRCAFMQHDSERLPLIEQRAIQIQAHNVKRFSPDSYSITEFNTQIDVDIADKIYADYPLFGEIRNVPWKFPLLSVEFNMTHQSGMFQTKSDGYMLYEGKMINQFDHSYSKYKWTIAKDEANQFLFSKELHRIGKNSQLAKMAISGKKRIRLPFEMYRFGVRAIGRRTDERALISTILPRNVCVGNSLFTALPFDYGDIKQIGRIDDNSVQVQNYSYSNLCFVIGLLNSFVYDWLIGLKIAANLNVFILRQLPLPRPHDNDLIYQAIVGRVGRLLCTDEKYDDLWKELFHNDWKDAEFWYPGTVIPYGPSHEGVIRKTIANSVSDMSGEWTKHSGVYSRTPDRRDTGDRAQLRAEIDAYVAHLYGLSREDFAYILDTFPVLKRKEEQAFGEYMSKRKCLEEYDRIKTILNAE